MCAKKIENKHKQVILSFSVTKMTAFEFDCQKQRHYKVATLVGKSDESEMDLGKMMRKTEVVVGPRMNEKMATSGN